MRVLICGDRNWGKPIPIDVVVGGFASVYGARNVTIINGQQRGADLMAASAAERHGVTPEPYPADWHEYGKAAGPIRNQQMLDEGKPDVVALRAAWHGAATQRNATATRLRSGSAVCGLLW